MLYTIFKHPCGELKAKFGYLFWLSVVMQDPPEKCRACEHLKPMPDGAFCCEAGGVGETHITADDIRRFALQKWRREQEIEALAATAKAEREGICE